MVWFGIAWFGIVLNGVWYDMWHGLVRCGMEWYGMVQFCMVWHSYCMARYGMVMVWYGILWFCQVQVKSRKEQHGIMFLAYFEKGDKMKENLMVDPADTEYPISRRNYGS